MKSYNGVVLKNGQRVHVSPRMIKECQLDGQMGAVINAAHNSEQLVTVNVIQNREVVAIDFHAKSLTVLEGTK